MVNKLLLTCCLLVSFATGISAQIGLNANYFKSQQDTWYLTSSEGQPGTPIMEKGYAFGINYWFRLKNYRVEFLPELSVGFSEADWTRPDNNNELTFKHTTANFFFNTQFYFLDIKGDCDCPTFSKEGPTFEKGLFLFLSPGLTSLQTKASSATEAADEQTFSVSIGAGIGMDFGISDFFTITPLLGIRYFPDANLPALDAVKPWLGSNHQFVAEESLTQYFAGLRVSVRFDYDKQRRRW
jgi:hypothetical protein